MAGRRGGSAVMLLGFGDVIGATEGAGQTPSIVLVVADDLSWGYVGQYGRTEQDTPDLMTGHPLSISSSLLRPAHRR